MFFKVSKEDWQYFLPFLICLLGFVLIDCFGIFQKTNLAYWSGGLLLQPHRVLTHHFVHADVKHLIANTFGIVCARYCFKILALKGNLFFVVLVITLIPVQSLMNWLIDIFILENYYSLSIGFSGIIYGVNSFILLASLYGKKNFLWLKIDLKIDHQVRQISLVLIGLGFFWSLSPGVNHVGHFSGFLSGILLFTF